MRTKHDSADHLRTTLAEPSFDAAGNSHYAPCMIGLHLCGTARAPGDDLEQPYTALNLPAPDHATAKAMFEAAKAEACCDEESADYVCDLNLGNQSSGCEHVDDFYTNRQLLPRLIAAVALIAHLQGEAA